MEARAPSRGAVVNHERWILFFLGAGTANYWIAHTLARSLLARRLDRVVICDWADVRPVNAATCPDYAGRTGPKSFVLAELMYQWMAGAVPIEPFKDDVGRLPWWQLIPEGDPIGQVIFVQGLDEWTARLITNQEIRARMDGDPNVDNAAIIQVGVDANLASLAMYGCRFSQPCNCCDVSGALPRKQACTALNAEGGMLRGNLHAEAQAAAKVVEEMVASRLGGPSERERWMGQKMQLYRSRSTDERFDRIVLSSELDAECIGPHSPVAPVWWDTSSVLE